MAKHAKSYKIIKLMFKIMFSIVMQYMRPNSSCIKQKHQYLNLLDLLVQFAHHYFGQQIFAERCNHMIKLP